MTKNDFIKKELLKRSIARGYFMGSEGKSQYSEISGNFAFEIDNGYNTGYNQRLSYKQTPAEPSSVTLIQSPCR